MISSLFFQKRKMQRLNWIKLFFFLSLIAVFSFFLIKINNMFISVLLAVVLSQLIRPLVDRIEDKLGLERMIAAAAVFLIVGAGAVFLIVWVLPFLSSQFQVLKVEISNYIEGFNVLVDQIEAKLKVYMPFVESFEIIDQMKHFFVSQITLFMQDLPKVITNSFSVLFLCPFLAFFMVKDSYKIHRGFLSLVPNHVFEMAVSLTHKIGEQVGRFIRARLFEAFIVGAITGLGLHFISFPYAFLLGVFGGLMNLIPYVGPVIGFAPALLIGLVHDMDLMGIFAVILVYAFAQIVDNVVLIPILVARMMKLHPITVVVVVVAGAQFMGILGMVISIPIANAVQVAYHAVYQHIIQAETNPMEPFS